MGLATKSRCCLGLLLESGRPVCLVSMDQGPDAHLPRPLLPEIGSHMGLGHWGPSRLPPPASPLCRWREATPHSDNAALPENRYMSCGFHQKAS